MESLSRALFTNILTIITAGSVFRRGLFNNYSMKQLHSKVIHFHFILKCLLFNFGQKASSASDHLVGAS